MKLHIRAHLDYNFATPSDVLIQLEAAAIPEQVIESANLNLSSCEHFARVPAQDAIGERIWLRAEGQLTVDYEATVSIQRLVRDCSTLPRVEPRFLPGETVQYLMASRYCPSDQFEKFVDAEFDHLDGGARIMAMRDWIETNFTYSSGSSTAETTALDTFVRREGVCRDYAHVLITLARASGIPARIASVYALGVEPQDFHAVAEVFIGNEWHLVDPTGMASEANMAKIGIGRDAADVSFLTSYGNADFNNQWVQVTAV
ncbi:transglutaminase-like domain-containing protein [Sphingomonas sp. LT1P40]|uniref:transglutaminase-like domain-containing protein n=1 Tax=Alteristakelama amylovorans TaxID=3096166 RepID=UPI002FCC260A